jgi:hypothetical protein
MTLIASSVTHSDQHKKTVVGGQQFPEQMVKSTGIRTKARRMDGLHDSALHAPGLAAWLAALTA